jgi:hypothetical protein
LRAAIRHIKNLNPKSIVVNGGSEAKKTDEVAYYQSQAVQNPHRINVMDDTRLARILSHVTAR